jgi:PPOX class probable F420-dependent enzyme
LRKSLRPEDLGDLLTQPKVAVLATQSANGSTLLAPVWHEWSDGGFTVVIDGNDAKIVNLRRDRHCSMVVAEDDPPYRGIEVRGEAKFVDKGVPEIMRRLAERYLKDRNVDAYLERMRGWAQEAVVLRLEPGGLRAWDFADEEWWSRY